MPRKGPPEGYMTATEAMKLMGKMLYKHVASGALTKYGPGAHRKQGFYKTSEVYGLIEADRVFYDGPAAKRNWRDNPSTTFRRATDEDMPTIVEISRHNFGESAMPAEVRLTWLHKNPETFHVLESRQAGVVGYASFLPLTQEVINRLVHDDIRPDDITADDVGSFEPGSRIHLYIMSIAIDARFKAMEKHTYGAALVNGMFTFLYAMAERGIEIVTIVARSHKPDGLRLLRKMGFPSMRSPVEGKNLFVVNVAESGLHVFIRYCEHLEEWKRRNYTPAIQKTPQRPPRERKALSTVKTSTEASPGQGMPDGFVVAAQFAEMHGIALSTLKKAIQSGRLRIAPGGPWVVGKATVRHALDGAGRAQFYQLYHTNPHFQGCLECPHKEQS